MAERLTMEDRVVRQALAIAFAAIAGVVLSPVHTWAQESRPCRFICEVAWRFEPTFTTEHLASRPRIVSADGQVERVEREQVFETVFALDLKSKLPWLGFSAEASTIPFADDNSVQLEVETNFYWLPERLSHGWVSSHFDVVDQFSPSERPESTHAYGHKLDFELDTAVLPFKRLAEGRSLRGVELETSLDYLATGLPHAGDVFPDGRRYLDDASHWSISFLIVVPLAPF